MLQVKIWITINYFHIPKAPISDKHTFDRHGKKKKLPETKGPMFSETNRGLSLTHTQKKGGGGRSLCLLETALRSKMRLPRISFHYFGTWEMESGDSVPLRAEKLLDSRVAQALEQ